MRIPRYWAQVESTLFDEDGNKIKVPVYGWSDSSAADAEAQAKSRASHFGRVKRRSEPTGWYLYSDRPIREPVIEDLSNQESKVLITRSRYGAKVMNTSHVGFIDIDVYENDNFCWGRSKRRPTWWDRLLKRPDPMDVKAEELRLWFSKRGDVGMRLYQTPNGYRGIFTHALMDPTGGSTESLFRDLGADALYIRLCKAQECFRARLTAKPWRINAPVLSSYFPYTFRGTPEQRKECEKFDRETAKKYDEAASGYAACRYVGQLGRGSMDREVKRVIDRHDELCGALTDRALA